MSMKPSILELNVLLAVLFTMLWAVVLYIAFKVHEIKKELEQLREKMNRK